MTPLFWKDIGRPGCNSCHGTGESQGRGFKYVCEQCAYNNIMDLRRRLEAAREALRQAAMDLCPRCGVHDPRERGSNHWCHPESNAVCVASDTWDRRDRLLNTTETAYAIKAAAEQERQRLIDLIEEKLDGRFLRNNTPGAVLRSLLSALRGTDG